MHVKHFGGKPGTRGPCRKADMPGSEPVRPTKGRLIDQIGFEVDDLEKLCKQLAADGWIWKSLSAGSGRQIWQ